MPTTFPFSEPKIKALKPPAGKDREYVKDATFPGLQCCITAAGGKSYYLVKRTEGKPTRHLLGTAAQLSVADARKAAAALAGDIASGRNPQAVKRGKRQEPTLAALWEHWLQYARSHKKPRSVEEDERNWKLHLKPWENRKLGSVKKTDVQALHARLGSDNGIYCGNRVLALLRAMYNKASDLEYRGENPAAGVKLYTEVARDRFLQADELGAFFKALEAEPELFRDFFLIALLSGARKSNVLAMRWAELDLHGGYWRIPNPKRGGALTVPLIAPALSILNKRREASEGSEWVFPGHRRGTHLANPQKSWARVCMAAGLKDLRPHDLRRSLGSHMASANVSLNIIGSVLGHRPGSAATSIYARLADSPQRQAMSTAATTMLTAGGQMELLTVDVNAKEDK